MARAAILVSLGLLTLAAVVNAAGNGSAFQGGLQNLTLAAALDVVQARGPLPDDLQMLVQALRSSSSSASGSGSRSLRSGRKPSEKEYKEAKANLNTMIEEAVRKRDLEEIKCAEYKARQSELIEETRQDVAFYSSQAAGARSHMLAADATIQHCSLALPRLLENLKTNDRKCEVELIALKDQLALVTHDMASIRSLSVAVSCKEGAAALLQCTDDSRSFVTFERPDLNQLVEGLKSPVARRALQDNLGDLLAPRATAASPPSKTSRPHSLIHHRLGRSVSRGSLSTDSAASLGTRWLVEHYAKNSPGGGSLYNNTDDMIAARKLQRKCTMTVNPDCESTSDRLMVVATSIKDSQEELQTRVTALQANCKESTRSYKAQIASLEARQKEAQAVLADAIGAQTSASEQSRLKSKQVAQMDDDFHKYVRKCQESMKGFEEEICGIRRVRGELHTTMNEAHFVQDCEVSPWSANQCSKSCGGGRQRLTRSIASLPMNGGAKCPPLTMKKKCNEQGCPVDCEVSSWTEWSACTARCGGGVIQRSRAVKVEPKRGGKLCGMTSEAQSCNLQACDRECELAAWTEWSSCSKMCGGGLVSRHKTVARPAEGAGKCPAEGDPGRLQYKLCNEQACMPSRGQTLLCASKIDLVLLLDGSGSVGKEGWEATKLAAQMLVQAFHGGPEERLVGVLAFGGPRTWDMYEKCTDGEPHHRQPEKNGTKVDVKPEQEEHEEDAENKWEPLDVEKVCHLRWVSDLKSDMEAISKEIASTEWPGGSTLTASALMAAVGRLSHGRQDAQSVLVVITDGKPASPLRTGRAAAKVREQARLIWVPVTKYDSLEELKAWASRPFDQNIFRIDDYSTLSTNVTVSNLVANICPAVV